MQWYDEKKVKNRLLEWLDSRGYTESIPQRDRLHGADIQKKIKVPADIGLLSVKDIIVKFTKKVPKKDNRKVRTQYLLRDILGLSLRLDKFHLG